MAFGNFMPMCMAMLIVCSEAAWGSLALCRLSDGSTRVPHGWEGHDRGDLQTSATLARAVRETWCARRWPARCPRRFSRQGPESCPMELW
mmetsp:Transcript_65070/g.155388  ORF Transcript_65070/g.155388 Transcript_65070/m.155388 type:complete len:90 (-) Transcript_65070:213-482(-)